MRPPPNRLNPRSSTEPFLPRSPELSSLNPSAFLPHLYLLIGRLLKSDRLAGNTHIKTVIAHLVTDVGEGVPLSRSMKKSGFFPAVLIDIVTVGEQTGKISLALQRGATRYDKEFNTQIQRLTVLIQPVTILCVAIFVGVIAYSMITGILTTVSGLKMH